MATPGTKAIFIGSTPDGLPSTQAHHRIASFGAYFQSKVTSAPSSMPARIKATTAKLLKISEFRGAELLLLPCAYPLGPPSGITAGGNGTSANSGPTTRR